MVVRQKFRDTAYVGHKGVYTPCMSHKKEPTYFFVRNFVKNQQILMQFSLFYLTMNNTCDGINFTHLT